MTIEVRKYGRGRIGFVTRTRIQQDGRTLYSGYDLDGQPWVSTNPKEVTLNEFILAVVGNSSERKLS